VVNLLVLMQLIKPHRDPYNKTQRGVGRAGPVERAMVELDADVVARGGWSLVTTVHVVGKNIPDPEHAVGGAAAAPMAERGEGQEL